MRPSSTNGQPPIAATLAVRTLPVTLRPPKRKAKMPAVPVWAVVAREIDPPAGVDGLEWMVLTTVEVKMKDGL